MSTTLTLYDAAGAEVGTFAMDDACLEREKGEQAVHDSVVSFLAAQRAGTASTKNRARIRGSGAKPYRQKGTGRARAGSRKSPIWRGGGVAFGPSPRSFAKRVNRKVHRLALRRALAERIDAGDVIVVDELSVSEAKTRRVVELLKGLGVGQDALIITDEIPLELELGTRNLPGVEVMRAGSVNTYWLLLFGKIVVSKAGLEALGARLGA